jgi:glycosyltransferase involved in cell wall biosynthesis
MATVTIGMPLYNNARTIERAVRSLQAQTHADFSMLISDDGSRDDTVDIVRGLAREDARIEVVQQPKNLNYGNFRFVLQRASTPFFVFAAGDDWWEPEFLERCLEALHGTPEAICAAPKVLMHPDDAEPYISVGTCTLNQSAARNIAQYLIAPGDNCRMYGVYRTEAAQRAFPPRDHFAFDWTFCAASLAYGSYVEVDKVLMHREVTPGARYIDYVRRDNRSGIDRLFPLMPMTRELLFPRRIPVDKSVLHALVELNFLQHRDYVRRFLPRLDSVYRRIGAMHRSRGAHNGQQPHGLGN